MANRGEQSCVRPRAASVRLTSIVAVIAACLVVFAFVGVYRASAVEDPPLRIAISPWPGYEFATLAQQKGFFADEGVRVELRELSSLGESTGSLRRWLKSSLPRRTGGDRPAWRWWLIGRTAQMSSSPEKA